MNLNPFKKEPAPKTDHPSECIEPDVFDCGIPILIDVSELTPTELLMHKAAYGILGQPTLKINRRNF